jgi:hypothetical protein
MVRHTRRLQPEGAGKLTLAPSDVTHSLEGFVAPRIAPPLPAKSLLEEYRATATGIDLTLMPWQLLASRYLTATGKDGWTFREVAIVVARQNGKTKLLVPRILMDLRAGKHIIHTAQNRILPRQVFFAVAQQLNQTGEIPKGGYRQANGQERIDHESGGSYVIVAPQRGARGLSADTLIFDELREFEDYEVIAAATPTLTASSDPQTIYLSNAGSDASVVLNDLKRRGEEGGNAEYAYLEWSADPDKRIDDRTGWAQANPALGQFSRMQTNLENAYASKPAPEFETEHLCRWVASMQPKLVSDAAWNLCQGDVSTPEQRPSMAFNAAPDGKRASAALSWPTADGRIALVELAEVTGDPIDVDALGKDLKKLGLEKRVRKIGFSSWTDAALARHMSKAEAIDAKEFAAASANFVQLVQSGRLVWDACDDVTGDLAWASRKPHEASGSYVAVPAAPERSITACLAAIRATWLASAPKPTVPRIG